MNGMEIICCRKNTMNKNVYIIFLEGLTYVDKNTVRPVSNLQTNDSQKPVLLMTHSKWFIWFLTHSLNQSLHDYHLIYNF